MAPAARALLGDWGAPPDRVAIASLAAGVVLLALALRKRTRDAWMMQPSPRLFLGVSALLAALLSLGYVAFYLRGGPRIIDATTYSLEARALSEGHLHWPVPMPSASFRGRFLLYDDGTQAGIFPPGYPAVLALGYLVGAPMLVGPLLAAAIVLATYALAREVSFASKEREAIARAAALVSVACAALRYHTADTMSHGATALWVTVALASALAATRTRSRWLYVLAGFALGATIATRPVSAMPIGLVVLWIATRAVPSKGSALAFLLALVPGVLLLSLHQHAATGQWLSSTQRAYYAASDGPSGCFRYGFGAGIGCLYEHGDFVRARLPNGFGAWAAAGTTLRRLHLHLSDALNAWPLGVALVAVVAKNLRKHGGARWLLALVALHVLAYAPFYFDGNYPGGGARFYADVLPAEHVLAALALSTLPSFSLASRTLALVASMLVAFALHASFDHRALAEREGGRPMFAADDLRNAGISRGLVLVDTDHAFDLGFDPASLEDADSSRVIVARARGDAHDRVLFDALGHPPTYALHYDTTTGAVSATPLDPGQALGAAMRFETENDWPPLAQHGASAMPVWAFCASGSRALEVTPEGARGEALVALPIESPATYEVSIAVLSRGRGGRGRVRIGQKTRSLGDLERAWTDPAEQDAHCTQLPTLTAHFEAGELVVSIEAEGAPVAVDRIETTRIR